MACPKDQARRPSPTSTCCGCRSSYVPPCSSSTCASLSQLHLRVVTTARPAAAAEALSARCRRSLHERRADASAAPITCCHHSSRRRNPTERRAGASATPPRAASAVLIEHPPPSPPQVAPSAAAAAAVPPRVAAAEALTARRRRRTLAAPLRSEKTWDEWTAPGENFGDMIDFVLWGILVSLEYKMIYFLFRK